MRETLQTHVDGMRSFVRQQLGRLPWVMGILFVVCSAAGYVIFALNPSLTNELMKTINEMFSQAGVMDESGGISFFGILLNNWFAMLFSVLYGFLPFVFLPVLSILSNAILLGAMAAYYTISGLSLTLFFAGILPHGIFEIPALLLAVSMGVALCRNIIRRITHSPKGVPMAEFLTGLLQTMLLLIFPLILVAAAVESFITPALLQFFL